MFETGRLGPLEWAVAGRPLAGESVSGDGWLVVESADQALFGAIDGLGHGEAAAVATQLATKVVSENPGAPLDELFALCHHALEGTRGSAMTLVRIGLEDGPLSWLGIGNVAAYLVRVSTTGSVVAEAAMLRGGIIGQQLPSPLRVRDTDMLPGDLLLLGTDGLASGFAEAADLSMPTGPLVTEILENCAKGNDDALLLAVRNRGPSR
ncbi:MAG TPA: SpoIIE family protein phosphatase [Jatrophihabitantaceae bacterium]